MVDWLQNEAELVQLIRGTYSNESLPPWLPMTTTVSSTTEPTEPTENVEEDDDVVEGTIVQANHTLVVDSGQPVVGGVVGCGIVGCGIGGPIEKGQPNGDKSVVNSVVQTTKDNQPTGQPIGQSVVQRVVQPTKDARAM